MRKFKFSDLNNKHFLALAGNAVISVLSVVTIGLLYRSLGKADVGTWFFFLSILSLGDALRNGLLSTATVKFYAGTTAGRAEEVLGSVWYLATALTFLMFLIDAGGMLFIPVITNPLLITSIQWFGVTLLSTLPTTVIFWILVADEQYGKILWLRLVNSGSMILVIAALIFLKKMTIDSLLWCNLLTNILTCLVGFVLRLARLKTITSRSKACVSEILHFGKYSLGTSAASKLLQSTDVYIVTFMLGPAAVAVYNLPLRLMEIIEIPLRTFVGTGMSAMASAYNNKNIRQASYILSKYAGMLTMAFIPLTIMSFFFADLAIYILGGSKYIATEAANILRIFMIISLMYPADRFNGVGLDIVHKPKINFYKVLIMLAVNIAGDFVGIYFLKSMYGAALSSFLTVLSGLLFGYFQLRKYMEFSFRAILMEGYIETKLLLLKTLGKG